jgi:NAD(P)H-hydrate epimerase
MKIFRSEQIKEIDEYTIRHEPIASAELMERASGRLFNWITGMFDRSVRFVVFAGPGNNGGDGLALARMLASDRYDTEVHYVKFTENRSSDWEINRQRLEEETNIRINTLTGTDQFPVISSDSVIIDAIFGSGLTRKVEGFPSEIIKLINDTDSMVIAVDMPSGLFGEDNSENVSTNIIKAEHTLSFQFPKLSFMFAENAQFVGEWEVLPIGLHNKAIRNSITPYHYLGLSDIAPLVKERKHFDHKGIFGHGLMVSGSYGKMGAAVLAAGAALRTGIGLLTCHIPSSGGPILQTSLPEAMLHIDKSEKYISEIGDTEIYSAIGAGPGIGTVPETQRAIHSLITGCKKPLVIDADGLNILALNKEWLSLLPKGAVLTPHPKEFERIAGRTENSYVRLSLQIAFSAEYNCVVVLKGAHTSITTPEGKVMFNSTGNPGMATAGSGDVLTGIILSLLAQGYSSEDSAVLGVYLHGLAGDIAAGESSYESLIASDIIKSTGKAFNKIREYEL